MFPVNNLFVQCTKSSVPEPTESSSFLNNTPLSNCGMKLKASKMALRREGGGLDTAQQFIDKRSSLSNVENE